MPNSLNTPHQKMAISLHSDAEFILIEEEAMQNQFKITSRCLTNTADSLIDALCASEALKIAGITLSYDRNNSIDNCDALIIDTDTVDGLNLWRLQSVDHLSPILIAYTANPGKSKVGHSIQKPLRPSELLILLKNLSDEKLNANKNLSVTPRFQTSANSISAATSRRVDNNIPTFASKASKSLLQAIIELNSSAIAVQREELEIVIDFKKLTYTCNRGDMMLKELLLQDSQDFVIKPQTAANINNLPTHDLMPVLMEIVTVHHHNQLFPWFDSNDRFQLSRWPDFSLLSYQPKHVKIAVAIKQQACAMAEIIQRCNLSFAEVAGFINLCYTLGYVHHLPLAHEMLALPAQPVSDRPTKINLFSKIRKRLGIL